MSNSLRILWKNVADAAASVSLQAAITAPTMGLEKLKSPLRGEACRILSNSATIVLTWSELTSVGCVVLPMSNLGPSSTIRIRAYLDGAGSTLLEDTGVKFAAPGAILGNWGFSQTLNVNAFTDNLPPLVCCYLSQNTAVKRLEIELADPDLSFVDISRLVVGSYREFDYGAGYGATTGTEDMSKSSRAASGDLRTDWGPKFNKLNFDLEWVSLKDRAELRHIFSAGIGNWLFVSLLPGNEDPVIEREYSLYGKLAGAHSMAYSFYQMHSTQFQLVGF